MAAEITGQGGIQYVAYYAGSNAYVAADNDNLTAAGELLVQYFQISLNDDGRIFATAINDQDLMVLYEFDPVF